jgi:hypothetical protein
MAFNGQVRGDVRLSGDIPGRILIIKTAYQGFADG